MGNEKNRWFQQFAVYLNLPLTAPTPGVYMCPSEKNPGLLEKRSRPINHSYPISSYIVNQENGFIHTDPASVWNRSVKLGSLKNSSQFTLLAEREGESLYYFNWVSETSLLALRKHLQYSNYLHSDGHVSQMKITEAERINKPKYYDLYFLPNGIFSW